MGFGLKLALRLYIHDTRTRYKLSDATSLYQSRDDTIPPENSTVVFQSLGTVVKLSTPIGSYHVSHSAIRVSAASSPFCALSGPYSCHKRIEKTRYRVHHEPCRPPSELPCHVMPCSSFPSSRATPLLCVP